MATSKEKQTIKSAEQTRIKRHSGIKADLALPEVAGIIDPADGTLNKDVLQSDLTVTLQAWDGVPTIAGDTDTVFLDWAAGATQTEACRRSMSVTGSCAVQWRPPNGRCDHQGGYSLVLYLWHRQQPSIAGALSNPCAGQ